jgi:hypothetical protein
MRLDRLLGDHQPCRDLGVLAAWAAALLAGGLLLRLRDA